jgi:hypothetical protein
MGDQTVSLLTSTRTRANYVYILPFNQILIARVDSASKNEYQGFPLGVKAAGA